MYAIIDRLCTKYKFRFTKDLQKECDALFVMCDDKVGRETRIKERMKQLKQYRLQLENLLKLPKIEQKTEEWYAVRQNMITASDFAQALGKGKFGTVKQFYQKKCEVMKDESFAGKTNPFFKWGNMFEPVAIQIYSALHDVTVHEFGLLKHPNYNFFGASPDGITENGIMVEIKCPMKRKIDGEVPMQYYYQIQGQLDVCNLRECDYFECEFGTYESENEMLEHDCLSGFAGITIESSDDGSFNYSDIKQSKMEAVQWSRQFPDNYIKTYWYLSKYNIKRVERDDNFLKEKMHALREVWEKILRYRQDRKAFEIEVLNEINIETQRYKEDSNVSRQSKQMKLSGWAFIDDDTN